MRGPTMREFFDRGRVGLATALAAVTVLAALPGTAFAEDVEAILRHGNDLRRQGRDAEALTEFQRAARIEESPRTTAQIALAEQALGMWPEAESHLSSALGREGDPWIRKNRAVLDKALATIHSHLCLVEVWGLPAGALILVDGKRIGSLPSASAWLSPGEVSMQVKADGYVPLKRTLAIPAAGNVREHVTLRSAKEAEAAEGVGTRRPAPSRAAPSRPAAIAAADPPASARRDPSPQLPRIAATDDAGTRPAERSAGAASLVDSGRDNAAPESASTLRRSAKWISWGVAVVGGGIGSYGLLRNHSLVNSFDSRCAVDPRTDTAYATDLLHATDASCASSRESYQAAGRLALYGFVGAAVLGTVGLVFWLTEPAPGEKSRTVLATCAPELALDRALLGCWMRF